MRGDGGTACLPDAGGQTIVVVTHDERLAASCATRVVRFLDFPNASGGTTELRVVGIARSVSRTADGWVEPGDVTGLAAKGTATGWQMLYRFSSASSAAQLAADRGAVASQLPAGSVSGTRTWLDVKNSDDTSTGIFIPFLTAFGLLGVLMSVFIVGLGPDPGHCGRNHRQRRRDHLHRRRHLVRLRDGHRLLVHQAR